MIPKLRTLSRAVRYGPRILRGGGIPEERDRWERQYSSGHWNYLAGVGQMARYNVIAGYCMLLKPGGRLLDVGCGNGVLAQRMHPESYSELVGVDISEDALVQARERKNGNVRYLRGDVEHPSPMLEGPFDAVIFNEVVYYFSDPLATLRRYEKLLADDGVFIVSIQEQIKHFFIWKKLERAYRIRDEVLVKRAETACRIKVLQPFGKGIAVPA